MLNSQRALPLAGLGFCLLLYFALGYAMLRHPGIQEDEVLFTTPLYEPKEVHFTVGGFGGRIPVMLDTYLGCVKTLVYKPIFKLFQPSVYSIRLPVLLLGAAGIALFWFLLWRAFNARAAFLATLLLAVDPIWIITSVFDWGPVAIQHFLLLAAVTLFLEYLRSQRTWLLTLAALCTGIGLWDKATLVWPLAGLLAGAIAIYGKDLWQRLRIEDALRVLCFGTLGAFPFLFYNWKSKAGTVREVANVNTQGLTQKLTVLLDSLNGSAMFGWITRDAADLPARRPATTIEQTAVQLYRSLGEPIEHLLPWLLAASAVLLVLAWRSEYRKPMLFALVAFAAGFAGMLLEPRAGGGSHHHVLLWPLPQLFAGLGLAWLMDQWGKVGRGAALAAALAVSLSAAVVTVGYLSELVVRGPSLAWTDACHPLRAWLAERPMRLVAVLDWGIVGPLRVLGMGRLPMVRLSETPGKVWTADELNWLAEMTLHSDVYFIDHPERRRLQTPIRPRLEEIAARHKRRAELVKVVIDRNGRPVYEVFHYVAAP